MKSVDGSSVQHLDTPENQEDFPQPSNQKKDCCTPVMKFLGLLNHSTGAWEKHLTDQQWDELDGSIEMRSKPYSLLTKSRSQLRQEHALGTLIPA